MTLLNCDQDTQRCWKASMLRLLSLKIFWARKRKCSGNSPRLVPTSAMNLRFRVSHIFSQGTLSATTKGTRSWVKEGERGRGQSSPGSLHSSQVLPNSLSGGGSAVQAGSQTGVSQRLFVVPWPDGCIYNQHGKHRSRSTRKTCLPLTSQDGSILLHKNPPCPISHSESLLTTSEKALSHKMVALALLSWLPWTMTTKGRDRA